MSAVTFAIKAVHLNLKYFFFFASSKQWIGLDIRLHKDEISHWLGLMNEEGSNCWVLKVCFWQRTYGRNLAFPGTLESLEQEEVLKSYWKALEPSRSTVLESEDSYLNCI